MMMAHPSPASTPHLGWVDSPAPGMYRSSTGNERRPQLFGGAQPQQSGGSAIPEKFQTSGLELSRHQHLGNQLGNVDQHPSSSHRNVLPQLPSLRQVLGPIPHSHLPVQSPFSPSWGGDSSASTATSQQSPSPSTPFERCSQQSPDSEMATTPPVPSQRPTELATRELRSVGGTHSLGPSLMHQIPITPDTPMDGSTTFRDPPRSDPYSHSRANSTHAFTPERHSSHDSLQTQQSTPNLTLLRGRPVEATSSGEPLPQFVQEQNVPGEGPCYFYDDGSHCKTIIDGEHVNPQWGVTKAGKPRKRLAIACLTCREKKIKCEPEFTDSKCVQCEKFGRVCRFKSTSRVQQPAGSPYVQEGLGSGISPVRAGAMEGPVSPSDSNLLQSPTGEKRKVSEMKRPRSMVDSARGNRPSHRDLERLGREHSLGHNAKRRRQSSPSTSWGTFEDPDRTQRGSLHRIARASVPNNMFQSPPWGIANTLTKPAFSWQTDPYELDPELTTHLVDIYFAHVNAATYCMFPHKPFISWVQECREKTSNDLMLLYSMLTLSSIFSKCLDRNSYAKDFASVAQHAVDISHGKFSLQLAQSRMILAIYHFALGKPKEAWDCCGMAIRATAALDLNTERSALDNTQICVSYCGFSPLTLAECKRRTFWSLYIMDRFSSFCAGHPCVWQSEDIFIRLPCKENAYDEQSVVSTPYFDNPGIDSLLSTGSDRSTLGDMAHLIQVSSIWGNVISNIYRSSHHTRESNASDEVTYDQTQQRLDNWTHTLPLDTMCTPENIQKRIWDGTIGPFINAHALHHAALMKLNRHARSSHLSRSCIKDRIQLANNHARSFLRITQSLATACREKRLSSPRTIFAIPPFIGFVITAACDILSAAGQTEDLPHIVELMRDSLAVVDELAFFWATAQAQGKAIRKRIGELMDMMDGNHISAGDGRGNRGKWWINEPMETTDGIMDDLIYERDREAYISMLKG